MADPQEVLHPEPTSTEHKPDSKSQPGRPRHGTDVDAQEMIIASLREQVQDLFSQVSQLNNKLVQSYDRVSNLEDDLHVASSNLRGSSVKISQLEMERAQHLAALNTGLLVEKSHVTTELSRLMEKATEEAAQRGQAESARAEIEKDLDDLSASLFNQANTMVAEARFAQSLSERKVEDAERALKGAEEAVSMMQQQMQALQAEKEMAERKVEDMQVLVGKGKWIERQDSDIQNITRTIRLLNTHGPYQEFLQLIGHLRSLHATTGTPPAMPTLLQLPFLVRLSTEDSEPTVRLDLAPSLNWLSRRSVLSAIHSGQLRIEPISSAALISEATSFNASTTIAGLNGGIEKLLCALCGSPVFPTDPSSKQLPPPHSLAGHTHSHAPSWSSSIFRKASDASSQSTSPPRSPTNLHSNGNHLQQIHVFRLASQQTSSVTSTISSLPIPSLSRATSHISTPNTSSHPSPVSSPPATTIYPLCSSGWCLARLRTTCCLWAFVRSGIVERVWEEELATPPPQTATITSTLSAEKPPIPPRKRGIWGIASAISEKAASWGDSDKKTDKVAKEEKAHLPEERRLPPPLPTTHRPVPHVPAPPVHPSIAGVTSNPPAYAQQSHPIPPPLPKRSQGRRAVVSPPPEDIPVRKSVEGETTKPVVISDSPEGSKPTAVSHPLPLPPRVGTPANIPLPDSRPSTPSNVPDRVASPSAPPPIPRRAAARGSRIIAPGSRPGTPNLPGPKEVIKGPGAAVKSPESSEKSAGSSEKASDTLDAENQPLVNGEAEKRNSESSEGETSKGPEDATSDAKPKRGGSDAQLSRPSLMSRMSESTGEVFEDAPAPSDEPTDSTSSTLGDGAIVEATDTDLKTPTDIKDFSDQQIHVNGVLDNETVVVEADEETKEGAVVVNDEETGLNRSDNVKETDSSTREGVMEDNDDVRFHVGDITWEDKTWKQLVRLREDMFWARIGGLR